MIKTIEVLFYKGFKYGKIELEPYNIRGMLLVLTVFVVSDMIRR